MRKPSHQRFTNRVGPARLILVALLAIGAIGAWYALSKHGASPASPHGPASPPDPAPALDRAEAFYSSRPSFQRPRPHSEVPEGLPDLSAKTCGACHREIYEEWRISTHRRAWEDDAQFMEELHKSRAPDDPNRDVGWMCVNCHTPMTSQLEQLVVGLEDDDISKPIYVDNPVFDPALQREAITCATCHVRDGVVYGPWGNTDAPHPVARDEKLLDERACTSCHNATAHWPDQQLACFFSTGDEWAKSQFAERGESCQSCHMPEVTRKLAHNFERPERKTRRHWFGGSLIPKHPRFTAELAQLRPIFGSGVEFALEPAGGDAQPNPNRSPEFADSGTRCADSGPCTRLWIDVRNTLAGHHMPSGDPERHIDVQIQATTSDGTLVGSARDRIASRYQWWPTIELQYDNRIPAGASHPILLEVPDAPPDFEVSIRAEKFRMYEDAFAHHNLDGRYVRGRLFHESRWQVFGGQPSLIRVRDDKGERPASSLAP